MDNRIDVQIWLSTKQACRFLNKRLAPIIKINERVLVDLTYNNHFNRYFNLHGDYYMSGVYYSIEDIHAMFCFAIGLNTTVFAMDYESDTPLKTKIMLADGVYKVNDICEPPDDYKDKPAIVTVDGGGSVFAVYELADKNSNILLSTLNIEIQNNIERVKKYGINPFSLPLSEGKIVYKRDELERFIKAQTEPESTSPQNEAPKGSHLAVIWGLKQMLLTGQDGNGNPIKQANVNQDTIRQALETFEDQHIARTGFGKRTIDDVFSEANRYIENRTK